MSTRRTDPDKVQRIVAMAVAGMRPGDICSELKGVVKLERIYHIITAARAEGHDIPRFATRAPGRRRPSGPPRSITVWLAGAPAFHLKQAADERQETVGRLARRIIEAVARDGLFNAVLDDVAVADE